MVVDQERVLAWAAVRRALHRLNLIRPMICSTCGLPGRLHGHHEDYARPLQVEWLCARCHRRRHRGLVPAGIVDLPQAEIVYIEPRPRAEQLPITAVTGC